MSILARNLRLWCKPLSKSVVKDTAGLRGVPFSLARDFQSRRNGSSGPLLNVKSTEAYQDASEHVVDASELQELRPQPAQKQGGNTEAEPEPTGLAFSDLKGILNHDLLKAITVKPFKFHHMTPVQEAVLPLLPGLAEPYKEGESVRKQARDLLVRAKTGTGKTLAFLVPAIEARLKAINAHAKQAVIDSGATSDKHLEGRVAREYARSRVGTLIVSPTRELATQIANEAIKLAQHLDGFEVRLFTGGVSKHVQLREWNRGRLDIVVSTPGRLRDFIENESTVKDGLQYTQTLILDEADTLLDMGFRDDIQVITEVLPKSPERQTFLFSATIDRRVEQVARSALSKNHTYINTVSEDTSPVHAHVPQYHTVLPSAADQIPHVLRLIAHDQLSNPGKSKVIVFLNTTKMTQLFASILRDLSKSALPAGRHTSVYEIHSKRDQNARTNTSDRFRRDTSGASILVTSDVSARGVDYPGVSRVIQVGIPGSAEQYVHRVGRTGRAGGVVGRGDLVLLDWETGFLTFQLGQVPLKPVTLKDFKSQVTELAVKFDENPSAFSAREVPADSRGSRLNRRFGPVELKGPVSPSLEAMENEVKEFLSALDFEVVNEAFASMLGFYTGKSEELRCSKKAIVDGCKNWTVQACGLPKPPFVSDSFLKKLGVSSERESKGPSQSRNSSSSWSRPSFGNSRRDQGNRWEGRGQQRFKDERRGRDERSYDDEKPRQQMFGPGGRIPDSRGSKNRDFGSSYRRR